MRPAETRRRFYGAFVAGLAVVWPILSCLLGIMAAVGVLVAELEGWRLLEGVYFAFVTGLTVGYGDLVPKLPLSRVLAVGLGFTGILLTALFAAVGVRALEVAIRGGESPLPD